ncbi:MAG: hypothetical protein EPN84_00090, partial [Legionella sp.]
SKFKSQIPKLPDELLKEFMDKYGLSEYDAGQLVESRERAEYFEYNAKCQMPNAKYKDVTPKMIANWIINKKVDIEKVTPEELVKQIAVATQVVAATEDEINKVINKVIADNEKAVADFKSGKEQALMFLLGQCIRALQGAGDKGKILELLKLRVIN